MKIFLQLCMNDRNGNESGKLSALQLPGDSLDLQCCAFPPNRTCRIDGDHLVLGRKRWPIFGYIRYTGNIYWNTVAVAPAIALQILEQLRSWTDFHCDGGWVELADAYERGSVTEAHIIEAQKEHRW